VLEGLKRVVNSADDISVFGTGETVEEAEKDHDMILWNLCFLLQRSKPNVKQVTWTGHLVRGMGISPHPGLVQAIVDTNPPQDVKRVQHFLGMCNYL